MKKKKTNSSREPSSKKKIAIFHLGFFYTGGGERLVLQQALGLKKLGYEVRVFAPVVDKISYPELQKKVKVSSLVPSLPRWFPERESLQILFACLLAPIYSVRFLKYDIVIGANQPGAWFGWIIKVFWHKPYLIYLAQPTRLLHQRKVDQETGLWVNKKAYLFPTLMKFFSGLVRFLDQKSILGANLAYANGLYAKQVLEKTYNREFINCPAGVEIARGNSKGEIKIGGKELARPFILITNRHFPQKKFEFAILALPAVLEKLPNISLLITGAETNYTRILKNLVSELGLNEKVVFLGVVNENKLKELYQNASCYVYTSPEEDFGLGIIEAMSFGTPVVAWNAAGPKFILSNNKTGFLAKAYQINDFTDKIINLIENKELSRKIAKEALLACKENFSWDVHLSKIERGVETALREDYKLVYFKGHINNK